MTKASRRLAGLLAVVVTVVSAYAVGPATAQSPVVWDTQANNVPYLAWRGEQVKLVKCDPALASPGVDVEFFVEEWTGPGLVPRVEETTVDRDSNCAKADIVSLEPGLARVKLVGTNFAEEPILKHQFLVIWMNLTDPLIDEVGASDPTGDDDLGDPAGDGVFDAGDLNGRIQVEVKGTFPHPLGPGGQFTLPDAWPTIAHALADDSDGDPENDSMFWEIHDDRLKTETHPLYSACTTELAPVSIDAVDNCNGGSEGDKGPFSRWFGDLISAFGPYDPLRPEQTLLTDGKLDAGDAPMPAARVDVTIAKNSGGPSDISGVGSLESADKTEVYSRDGDGTPTAHNLYAPFYDTYIPSTSRPGLASGIDGPQSGNNFTGFLVNGLYDYWSVVKTLRTAVPTPTTCLRRNDDEGPDYRLTPSGAQSVVVYTDEHGEAQVEYNPGGSGGNGFYFDNLPGIRNDNGGCDLEDVDVLGTSGITATARYPYQPVSDTDKTSATLTKTVKSLFTKTLSYYPKGPGPANSTARIVVVHAQDIDGRPFAGERVCFFVDDEADGHFGFTGTTGLPGARFFVGGTDGGSEGSADVCRITDDNGNAAIEVINSDPQSINVVALFHPEALLRDIDLEFGTPDSSGGPTPPAGGAGEGTNPPALATATQQLGPQLAAQLVGSTAKSSKPRVALSYLKTKRGKRYLVVRVTSSKSEAKVRAALLGKRNRSLGTVTKWVRTNRLVSIRVSASVKKARVALAG
ncbi:MAG: hypothetical protein QOH58_1512 [Thermoleophilaceae bacterium]|jgi:hypothetical protein|nr:hypothetical protein [Thermoleophilaceae bacterium]